MSALYADDNVSWEEPEPLPGWEPWEDDEPDDTPTGGCAYCREPDAMMRENPEPFGGQPCCEACFNLLIGGDVDDPPWRCGTADTGGKGS